MRSTIGSGALFDRRRLSIIRGNGLGAPESHQCRFIVGVGGGSGTLTFRGKNYRLRLSGVSAGTIGASGMDLVGTASNLRTAADIAGTYSAASAGLAVAGGAKAVTLQNAKGVVLTLQGRQVGFQANLSVSGVTISLQ